MYLDETATCAACKKTFRFDSHSDRRLICPHCGMVGRVHFRDKRHERNWHQWLFDPFPERRMGYWLEAEEP